MSASHEYTERHLTPAGWLEGSTRIDPGIIKLKDPPIDRVLTMLWTERCNGYGPVVGGASQTWRSPDANEVSRLLEVYGDAPDGL